MKLAVILITVVALTGVVAGGVLAAENGATQKAQTTCPVMGGKIDKQYFADYEGKRVYFCCPACKAEFEKDPAKYVKKLEDAGVVLEKAPVPQTACPVTGKPIDTQYFADYEGKRVYFCCPVCKAEFEKDPATYVKKLEDAGVTLAKTPVPQTMCPIMTGNKINKKYFADYQGKRVYFCCNVCRRKFLKEPAKYVKQLEDEGITLDRTPNADE
jgi:YHS domain-containing protein